MRLDSTALYKSFTYIPTLFVTDLTGGFET